jgi:hypothetical protein
METTGFNRAGVASGVTSQRARRRPGPTGESQTGTELRGTGDLGRNLRHPPVQPNKRDGCSDNPGYTAAQCASQDALRARRSPVFSHGCQETIEVLSKCASTHPSRHQHSCFSLNFRAVLSGQRLVVGCVLEFSQMAIKIWSRLPSLNDFLFPPFQSTPSCLDFMGVLSGPRPCSSGASHPVSIRS